MSQSQMTETKSKLNIRAMALCAVFAALAAIGAFIKIPVPVVPFTLQFFFTTLAGLLLGKRYGSLSILLYIIIGLIGIPVFTEGGGISYVFKPTFGYIIGFCIGAYATGAITAGENGTNPSLKRLLCASFAGLAIVYACGMVYCYIISNFVIGSPIALKPLVIYCFVLAVPGDIVLCLLASVVAKRVIPVLKRKGLTW